MQIKHRKIQLIYNNIFHIYFTAYFTKMPHEMLMSLCPEKYYKRLFAIGKHTLKYLIRIPLDLFIFLFKTTDQSENIWLYTVSKNNTDVLETLYRSACMKQNCCFVSFGDKVPSSQNYSYLFKFFFLYRYFSIYRYFSRLDFGRAKRIDSLIYQSTGIYESCRIILKKAKPKAIVFTNDINISSRALLNAAKSLGIPTIYLQHASVTEYFPPLEFDLSLLDGEVALKQYMENGTEKSQNINLIGIAKFDSYILNPNLRKSVRNIGICSNLLDNMDKIKELIQLLKDKFPDCRLCFRPHPRQNVPIAFFDFVEVSESKLEFSAEFLMKQDLIIANHSNILLEAAMLNIYPVRYNLSVNDLSKDPYKFDQNGLVDNIDSFTELVNLINQIKDNRPLVKHRSIKYNDAIGKQYEGRSADLAASYINELLKK